jgi:hypothetical protein
MHNMISGHDANQKTAKRACRSAVASLERTVAAKLIASSVFTQTTTPIDAREKKGWKKKDINEHP